MQSNGLHPDTQVLLYLGGMKAAKNVERGDILIGDDNTPRVVLANDAGYDQLYCITPEVGEPFMVTDGHILSLYNEHTEQISEITLSEYISKSPLWKIKYKLYSSPVEYPKQPTKNDPYLVGLLLASEKKSIDDIIKEYLSKVLDSVASSLIAGSKNNKSIDTIDKAEIGYLLNHKYIPDEYLYNTRDVRLSLMCGFYEAATYIEKQEATPKKPTRSISQPVFKTKPAKRTSSKTACKVSFKDNSPQTAPAKKRPKRAASHSHKAAKPPVKKHIAKTKYGKNLAGASAAKKPAKVKLINKKVIKESNRTSRLKSHEAVTKKAKTLKIKDKILCEQLKFLIRSLGYECVQLVDSIITQNYGTMPALASKTHASFSVQQNVITNFASFTVDGNGRFLLASCMVARHMDI